MKKLKGPLEIQAFQGTSEIGDHTGNLKLQQQSGAIKILRGDSEAIVESPKAQVVLNAVKGRWEVQTQSAGIQSIFNQAADLNLRTQSGRIQVQVQAGLGPQVLAWSGSGDVSAPQGLKGTRDAYGKNVRGRFPATSSPLPQGSLHLRSQEGSILVQ